ncbi:MAG: hypothetical protein R3E50_11175 [Halioglobus sp.]
MVAAAARVGLKDYQVEYVEPQLSPRELLPQQLARGVGSLNLWSPSAVDTALSGVLGPMRSAARELAILQDPAHLYTRCIACGLVR